MVAKSLRPVVCAVCLSMMVLQGTVWAGDWPNWRGPNRDGISRETGWNPARLDDGPKILWRQQIGVGFSSMAVADGRVYTMGNTAQAGDEKGKDHADILWCFDAKTGDEIWRYTYASPLQPDGYEGGPSATPTVEAGRVYTLSKHGHVLCLDAATGAVIWQRHLGKDHDLEPPRWGFAGSPVIIGDLIVLNAGSYGLALHKQDGRLAWRSEKGPSGYASAVPYERQGQIHAAILGHREVFGVVAATGEVLWKHPWTTKYDENITDPIVIGDRVFVSTGLGTGAALLEKDGDTLREIWSHRDFQTWMDTSVLWQGHIYGSDMRHRALKCLDPETGEVKWMQKGFGLGTVMLADGKLIALSDAGRLIVAEATPERYNELASAQILDGKCWTVPVLSHGRIYARNAVGDLVCVDVSSDGE